MAGIKEDPMRPNLLALVLLAAGLAVTPALAQNRFWLVNDSGLTIRRAFVSPSRLDDWGNDILGSTRVAPGEQVRVTPSAKDCELDIKVQYEGGQEEEKMEVNACQVDRVVFTNPANRAEGPGGRIDLAGGGPGGTVSREDGEAPSFTFVNRSGETIEALFVSPSEQDRWGRDRLGEDTLAPGQRQRIALPARQGCAVDIRLVFDSHRTQERRHVAACGAAEIAWP
jgi:hypothetical protein